MKISGRSAKSNTEPSYREALSRSRSQHYKMPAATEAINIGLMGLGTVGGGVAAALSNNADEIRRKTGRTVRLRRALVRDATKTREPSPPPGVLTTNPEDILADPGHPRSGRGDGRRLASR